MRPPVHRRAADCGLLALVFLRELLLSSFAVARTAFSREPKTRSAIVAVPIALKSDGAIAVLANLVTLTPGTCSLHVSEDRSTLYVHALDAEAAESVVASIRGDFEARLARIEGSAS